MRRWARGARPAGQDARERLAVLLRRRRRRIHRRICRLCRRFVFLCRPFYLICILIDRMDVCEAPLDLLAIYIAMITRVAASQST